MLQLMIMIQMDHLNERSGLLTGALIQTVLEAGCTGYLKA
jgi:hypothetical protein